MNNAKYVDPIIGTVGDEQETSFHGGGKTHPGACLPFGMVQLSPDTTTSGDNGTGYNYCQNTIEGFSFNHMSGIGWYGDLGNIQVMPVVGKTDLRSGSNDETPLLKGQSGWKSPFSHEKEIAKAGYYSVLLEKYDIQAEATVSHHAGFLRLTYPKSKDAGVLFNFSRRIAGKADFQSVNIINNKRIEGEIKCTPKGGGFGRGGGNISYNLYFVCEFSSPAKEFNFFSNEEYLEKNLSSYSGEDVSLDVRFDAKNNNQIELKCAISYASLENAKDNFETECVDNSFDNVRKMATDVWEKAISCIEVEGNDQIDLTLFHTCLYHTLLDPRIMLDSNGTFKDANGEIKTPNYTHRTMFSGWDVYRSEMPLLTLIRPDVINDEINSLLNIAIAKGTSLPRWELMGNDSGCMVGDPGLVVFADAYLKGICNYDYEKAYNLCLASCKCEKEFDKKPFKSFHSNTEQYLKNAYVAGSLSETVEFLLADYAMYKLSLAMNKEKEAKYFLERVEKYKENFNRQTGFMTPRNEKGEFLEIKDEYDTTGCVESNIFQQSFFAPYDIEGLSMLFGKERMIELLERLFEKADFSALWNENYNHSNEPCHNLTHYFNILGLPERTQYWTRRVQKEAYRLGAFGFCGNEDVGQLSAWYVLSALGFAQICPAKDEFHINTPLFKKTKTNLDKNYHSCNVDNCFVIECDKDPLEFPYISEIFLNGEELERTYLTYKEITNGGRLYLILKK